MSQPSVSVLPLPAPPCGHRWSQLVPGMDAIVTAGDLPNRVRLGPSTTSDVIQQIYPQTVVHVLEGPVCSDGLVFWKVENESIPGGSGWTAEGDGTEYYLEPNNP